MHTERSDVEFPLWRKKVDASLFHGKGTTIPTWACSMWGIPALFGNCRSKDNPDAEVKIHFGRSHYQGWMTIAGERRKSPTYRLWFDELLCLELQRAFVMSYMRSLEGGLRKRQQREKGTPTRTDDTEQQIPFWEFLDIEFDQAQREFHFAAHYRQEPTFPLLFRQLIGTPAIQKVGDEIDPNREQKDRIYRRDWKPKADLAYEPTVSNVIYLLADSRNGLLYIGEAQDLVKRLTQPHPSIPDWDYFRYEVLPESLAPHRVLLERMLIRDFATLMRNKRAIQFIAISNCELANDKIDR